MDPTRLELFPIFAGLTPDERASIASWSEEREVSPGQTLAPEGASGYLFFLIEAGNAEVIHGGERVAELGPGDFFGEGALLGDGRRVASVVSTSPMRLIVMHGLQFRKMEAAMPDVASKIEETMTSRLQELNRLA